MKKEDAYTQAIQSILTMNRTLRKYSKKVNSEQITGRQLALLRHLCDTGDCTAGALARYLYISESSVSEQLRKLSQKGLVTKDRHENDNRIVTVSITGKGRELADRLPTGGILLLREKLKKLKEPELQAINQAVGKLNSLMETE